MELSGGCSKGMHTGLLLQEDLHFGENTRSLWCLNYAGPFPSVAQVLSAGQVWTREGAALQPNFSLRAKLSPQVRKFLSLQLCSVAVRPKRPFATCVVEALP